MTPPLCPNPQCDDGLIWGYDGDGREVATPCRQAVHGTGELAWSPAASWMAFVVVFVVLVFLLSSNARKALGGEVPVWSIDMVRLGVVSDLFQDSVWVTTNPYFLGYPCPKRYRHRDGGRACRRGRVEQLERCQRKHPNCQLASDDCSGCYNGPGWEELKLDMRPQPGTFVCWVDQGDASTPNTSLLRRQGKVVPCAPAWVLAFKKGYPR